MNAYKETDTILKVEDVSLSYGSNVILRDINFEVKDIVRPDIEQGQVIALIGRSGLGKTSLFRVLSGLQPPTTGKVLVGVDQIPVKAGFVGIIPQSYTLFNHRNVYDNLRLGLKHSGKKMTAKESDTIIREHATKFELTDHLKKYIFQLSGGQRQRVSILQQVLCDNKFLLLDEVFSGLDIIMVDKVFELLLKVSTMNELNTLIVVSHSIADAMLLADTVIVMHKDGDIPGATIKEIIDMKKLGLCWQANLRKNPKFVELVEYVKSIL